VKVQITHTVVLTVEEHTPEHAHVERALSTVYSEDVTRHRHGGDVTYRIAASDMDEVAEIRQAVGA